MSLRLLHGASLGNLNQAHELTEQCLTLVRPFAHAGEPKILRQLIGCYSLAAHWRTLAGHVSIAAQHLYEAEQIYTSLPAQHPFLSSMVGHNLRARIHEEWAEIASRKGHYQQALQHERNRLELILTQMQTHESVERLLGFAYHALAARLAAVDQFSHNIFTSDNIGECRGCIAPDFILVFVDVSLLLFVVSRISLAKKCCLSLLVCGWRPIARRGQ